MEKSPAEVCGEVFSTLSTAAALLYPFPASVVLLICANSLSSAGDWSVSFRVMGDILSTIVLTSEIVLVGTGIVKDLLPWFGVRVVNLDMACKNDHNVVLHSDVVVGH